MGDILERLRGVTGDGEVLASEPMSAHTSFKIGGPADCFVTPGTAGRLRAAIQICRDCGVPYYVIGGGSNLLVGDKGVRGAVICTSRLSDVEPSGETGLRAGAGASLAKVAGEALRRGLTGFEFASGIPGSFGGAVFMNAGAYGSEMKDVLVSAELLDGDDIRVAPAAELGLAYRMSAVQTTGAVVLGGIVGLSHGDPEAIHAKMTGLNRMRAEKQPLDMPSAGSAFKRPGENVYAARLIDECGLRGFAVGGAAVSPKHCGFIVNIGGATAADVFGLIEHVKKTVLERKGYALEPEIRYIGE